MLLESSGARDFLSRSQRAGFVVEEETGLGLVMKRKDCRVMFSARQNKIEFLSFKEEGKDVLHLVDNGEFRFSEGEQVRAGKAVANNVQRGTTEPLAKAGAKPEAATGSQGGITIPKRLDRPDEPTFEYLLAYWKETPLHAIENDFRELPIESIRLGPEVGDSRRQRYLYDLTEALCHTVVQYRYWQGKHGLPNLPAESLAELIVPRFVSAIVRTPPSDIHYAVPRRVVDIAEQFMQFRPLDSVTLAQWLIEVAKCWHSGDRIYRVYAVSSKKARSLEAAGTIQNAKNTKTKQDVNNSRSLTQALLRDYPDLSGSEIDREARALQDTSVIKSQLTASPSPNILTKSQITPSRATSKRPSGPADFAELDKLLDSGSFVLAVAWYRKVMGCDLREARDDVTAYLQQRQQGPTSQKTPKRP